MNDKTLRIAGLVLLFIVGWGVIAAVITADRSERCLHACIIVTDALEQHVRATGDWPSSWDELRRTVPSVKHGGIHRWPDDISTIRELVRIDFEADPELLAQATPESFDAVQPLGPCYSSYDRHFQFLITALRESQGP